jgi:hypothetical protein
MKRLLEFASRGREGYIRRWLGKTVNAAAEEGGEGFFTALTENYLRVLVKTDSPPPRGSALRCRIAAAAGAGRFDACGEIAV